MVSRELPKKLRDQVVTIRAESPYALVLVLDSGVEIAWGTSDQSALKGQVALALLKQDPKAVDVSSPTTPRSHDACSTPLAEARTVSSYVVVASNGSVLLRLLRTLGCGLRPLTTCV